LPATAGACTASFDRADASTHPYLTSQTPDLL